MGWRLSFSSDPKPLPDLGFQDRLLVWTALILEGGIKLEGLQGEEWFSGVDCRTSPKGGRLVRGPWLGGQASTPV